MIETLQWEDYSGKENDVVWKHPDTHIKWGAALIVHEYENAAFFRDGKMYAVFGPGRHLLTTGNIPVLSQIFKIHDKPSFVTTVFFVSNREFTGQFGGRSQTKELFPIIMNGQYWYKITDPTLFVNEVVGGNRKTTTADVVDFLRGFINQNIMKEFASYSLEDIFTKGLDDTALKTKTAIYDKLARFGIDLFDLKFNSLDTEERYRELAAMVKQGVSANEVLRMFTIRESAKELGKSTGGAALGAGFVLPQMVSQMAGTPPEQTTKSDDPLSILKRRLAKGEISKKEYNELKKALEDN
jgi:membrane protease subunit (stomatin/prohibitin family)